MQTTLKTVLMYVGMGWILAACQTAEHQASKNTLLADTAQKREKQKKEVPPHRRGIVFPSGYTDQVGDTLTVLSWNVEHFIDAHDNPYIGNEREDAGSQMKERIPLFLQALRQANADVVVLQEFESVQFLHQLAKDSLADMGYAFFADHESIDWYMNVVVMSRVPLGIVYGYGAVTTASRYTDEKTNEEKYETQSHLNTRMWSVDVLVNEEYSFMLTGVHLKAGRGPRNEAMRIGQIEFLKGQFERFAAENPNVNLLVVGDMNSVPGSKEIGTLLDGGSPVTFVDNLADNVHTHPAGKPERRLDYILPNVNMQHELIAGSLQPVYFFDPATQESIADHLPLMAAFLTRDVKGKARK